MSDQIDTTQIESTVTALVAQAPGYPAISCPVEANEVSAYLVRVAQVRKRVATFFRPNIDAAHALHKSLLAQLKLWDEKPAAIETKCKDLLKAWSMEQERLRRIEQDRLDEEARKQAAEKARQAAIISREQGDRRAAKAAEKEAKGIENGKVGVFSPVIAEREPVLGTTVIETYRAELTDLPALLKAIIAGKAPQTLVGFAQKEANRLARTTKGSMTIPGVKWIKDSTVRRT